MDNRKLVIKSYAVYGAEGHRQRETFRPSASFEADGVKFDVLNADKTGQHEYSIVIVYGWGEQEIREALEAQISDGIFENSRVGRVREIKLDL